MIPTRTVHIFPTIVHDFYYVVYVDKMQRASQFFQIVKPVLKGLLCTCNVLMLKVHLYLTLSNVTVYITKSALEKKKSMSGNSFIRIWFQIYKQYKITS